MPSAPTVSPAAMTPAERRASISLAGVVALRMLGLFLILPVFAEHAKTLSGGQNATLIGLAMGIYGLVQACGQLPFGMASDRWGRKPVIVIGLLIFAFGSFIAAAADSLFMVTVGRALQGGGAISAAVLALVADSTRETQRTKAMAMVGGSIAASYALSLIVAPLLYSAAGMGGIFGLTGALALAAIAAVLFVVPDVPRVKAPRVALRAVLADAQLMRLNVGVFVLHVAQLAVFIVLPGAIVEALDLPVAQHWKVYLPVVLASFVLMMPPLIASERKGLVKQVFNGAIGLLLLVQLGLGFALAQGLLHATVLVGLLLAFFVAFNILEASQPSLVSRIAPAEAKGTALGVYNTLQSLGLFCGGLLGGWIKQNGSPAAVFFTCAVLTACWLIMAAGMRPPAPRKAVTDESPALDKAA